MGRRDDLTLTAPSFFKCPISLDVMKSPVSLCTGVTYDRSSIQKWLDAGNNTCPATMQVLHNKEFVPNHTLHRLIQIWSASHDAVSQQDITSILALIPASSSHFDALSALRRFALESNGNRDFLAGLRELIPLLSDILSGCDSRVAEVVAVILDSLRTRIQGRKETELLATENCLVPLVRVLREGHCGLARAASARLIGSVLVKAAGEDERVLRGLVRSIAEDREPVVIEASLSCLIHLCGCSKRARMELVRLNVVPVGKNLLGKSVGVVEKTLELMGTVSSCKEGIEEMCREEGFVEAVVAKLMKVSMAATEHAVIVLWSACCMAKDEVARKAVSKDDVAAKLLILLQSNCSHVTKRMLSQLLRLAASSFGPTPPYDSNTIHVMPF